MHQSISCAICGQPISAHFELFAHADCQPPAMTALVQRVERLKGTLARYYGLKPFPLPWRSTAEASRPPA